jgi:hypothetical protein
MLLVAYAASVRSPAAVSVPRRPRVARPAVLFGLGAVTLLVYTTSTG